MCARTQWGGGCKVLEDKAEKSLRETRESITACFENISCFMLPHPGLCVTRKNYDGAISGGKGLEPEFRDSLDKYMRRGEAPGPAPT